MLRKILISAVVMIIFSAQSVFAKDVWVHTNPDGTEFFVMNETAEDNSQLGRVVINVKVKSTHDGELLGVHDYNFELTEGYSKYSLDGAEHEWIHKNKSAERVCVYCLNYLGIDVGKVLRMSD